jgi:hypothetical protein
MIVYCLESAGPPGNCLLDNLVYWASVRFPLAVISTATAEPSLILSSMLFTNFTRSTGLIGSSCIKTAVSLGGKPPRSATNSSVIDSFIFVLSHNRLMFRFAGRTISRGIFLLEFLSAVYSPWRLSSIPANNPRLVPLAFFYFCMGLELKKF